MAKLRISDVKKSTALEARMQRIEPRRRTTGMSKPRQRGEGWNLCGGRPSLPGAPSHRAAPFPRRLSV